MSLRYFPFDNHSCTITIAMYNMNMDNVKQLKTKEDWFGVYKHQSAANFEFTEFNISTDYENLIASAAGNCFSFANQTMVCEPDMTYQSKHEMKFHMKRKYSKFIFTLLLPNVILTILSWIVFWIEPEKLPERVSICIALILAQLILIVGEEEEFPQTSDVKLVDVYLITNFLMNAAVLFENILAATCSHPASPERDGKSHREVSKEDQNSFNRKSQRQDIEEKREKNFVDSCSKFIFPIGFLLWNSGFMAAVFYVSQLM